MAIQSRLYQLKSWLTLEDAASYLSTLFSEKVEVSDVLQLGLEGRLTLSINLLSRVRVKKGKVTAWMETPVTLLPSGEGGFPALSTNKPKPGTLADEAHAVTGKTLREVLEYSDRLAESIKKREIAVCPMGERVSDDEFVRFSDEILSIEGIWDLPLVSAERIAIEEMYQLSVNGPKIDLISLDGPWIKGEDNCIYCIQERFSDDHIREIYGDAALDFRVKYTDPRHYYPADSLSESFPIIVRRKNLDRFIDSLTESEGEKQGYDGEIRALEAMGLLAEVYIRDRGYNYRNGEKPNVSRIVEDMLAAKPEDVTKMSKRKLQDVVGDALKAWEAKKRF